MPDWTQHTQELTGRAPRETEPLLPNLLAGLARGLASLCGTALLSLGLTVLVNPPLREALWEWLQRLW